MRLFIVSALAWGASLSWATPYCAQADFFAVQDPADAAGNVGGRDPSWIVFSFDAKDPLASAPRPLQVPARYCLECEGNSPKLLDLICLPGHLRFMVGDAAAAKQLIYSIKDTALAAPVVEALKTPPSPARLPTLERGQAPLTLQTRSGPFRVSFREATKKVGGGSVASTSILEIEALDAKGKVRKAWTLWKKVQEETVD